MKKRIQIKVVGTSEIQEVTQYNDLVRCNICANGRTCTFWTTEANYNALIHDGFFIVDKRKSEPNGTTTTFIEEP